MKFLLGVCKSSIGICWNPENNYKIDSKGIVI